MKKFHAALKEFNRNTKNFFLYYYYKTIHSGDFGSCVLNTILTMGFLGIVLMRDLYTHNIARSTPIFPLMLEAAAGILIIASFICIIYLIVTLLSAAKHHHEDGAFLSALLNLTSDSFKNLAPKITLTIKERQSIITYMELIATLCHSNGYEKEFYQFCDNNNDLELKTLFNNELAKKQRYEDTFNALLNKDSVMQLLLIKIKAAKTSLSSIKDKLKSSATKKMRNRLTQFIDKELGEIESKAHGDMANIATPCKAALRFTHSDKFNNVLLKCTEDPPSAEEKEVLNNCRDIMEDLTKTLTQFTGSGDKITLAP